MLQKPLIITIWKNNIPIGAIELHIKNYIPPILKNINI